MKKDKRSNSECAVCYAIHDEEIHEATLRIHQWFARQVTHRFEDEVLEPPVERAS